MRVALDVETGQPKRAVLRVSDGDVGVSVVAPAKEGLANAELLEYMGKVLGVARPRCSSRAGGRRAQVPSGDEAGAGRRLQAAQGRGGCRGAATRRDGRCWHGAAAHAAGQADAGVPTGGAGADAAAGGGGGGGTAPTAGAGLSAARRHWEENEDLDDLAEAPTTAQQSFIK